MTSTDIILIALSMALLITIVFMVIVLILYLNLSKVFAIYKNGGMQIQSLNDETAKTISETMKEIDAFLNKTDLCLASIVPETEELRKECQKILDVASEKAAHITATSQSIRARMQKGELAQQIVYRDGKPDEILSITNKKEEEE